MKKIVSLGLAAAMAASVLTGCGAAEQRPALDRIEYTNLNDSGSRELLQELLSDAGVSDVTVKPHMNTATQS